MVDETQAGNKNPDQDQTIEVTTEPQTSTPSTPEPTTTQPTPTVTVTPIPTEPVSPPTPTITAPSEGQTVSTGKPQDYEWREYTSDEGLPLTYRIQEAIADIARLVGSPSKYVSPYIVSPVTETLGISPKGEGKSEAIKLELEQARVAREALTEKPSTIDVLGDIALGVGKQTPIVGSYLQETPYKTKTGAYFGEYGVETPTLIGETYLGGRLLAGTGALARAKTTESVLSTVRAGGTPSMLQTGAVIGAKALEPLIGAGLIYTGTKQAIEQSRYYTGEELPGEAPKGEISPSKLGAQLLIFGSMYPFFKAGYGKGIADIQEGGRFFKPRPIIPESYGLSDITRPIKSRLFYEDIPTEVVPQFELKRPPLKEMKYKSEQEFTFYGEKTVPKPAISQEAVRIEKVSPTGEIEKGSEIHYERPSTAKITSTKLFGVKDIVTVLQEQGKRAKLIIGKVTPEDIPENLKIMPGYTPKTEAGARILSSKAFKRLGYEPEEVLTGGEAAVRAVESIQDIVNIGKAQKFKVISETKVYTPEETKAVLSAAKDFEQRTGIKVRIGGTSSSASMGLKLKPGDIDIEIEAGGRVLSPKGRQIKGGKTVKFLEHDYSQYARELASDIDRELQKVGSKAKSSIVTTGAETLPVPEEFAGVQLESAPDVLTGEGRFTAASREYKNLLQATRKAQVFPREELQKVPGLLEYVEKRYGKKSEYKLFMTDIMNIKRIPRTGEYARWITEEIPETTGGKIGKARKTIIEAQKEFEKVYPQEEFTKIAEGMEEKVRIRVKKPTSPISGIKDVIGISKVPPSRPSKPSVSVSDISGVSDISPSKSDISKSISSMTSTSTSRTSTSRTSVSKSVSTSRSQISPSLYAPPGSIPSLGGGGGRGAGMKGRKWYKYRKYRNPVKELTNIYNGSLEGRKGRTKGKPKSKKYTKSRGKKSKSQKPSWLKTK